MPTDGRAGDNSLTPSRIRNGEGSEVACAAGQAQAPSNRGHAGDMRFKKPIADEDREALRRLIEAERMIRRSDGRYGTPKEALITGAIVARLKQRDLAVSGFDRKTIAPSDKGRRLYAEMNDATR